ncbi:MAG: response regulator transcription factor [Blautia sp.]
MYKILTVDDESEIVLMIKKYFTMCGYEVITACSGGDAIKKLKYEPDIILLDITMPGLDGLEVCRLIRNEIQCPILLLTARTEIKERVRGFETGADDYIVKPFDMEELHARIDAHIRRENRIQKRKEMIRFYKDMIINYERRQVKINGQEITLSKKEFDIIAELSLNAGRVFSREKIYENIWGFDKNGNNETVIEHIRRIRMKLSEVSDYEYIKTVWGCGYTWNL